MPKVKRFEGAIDPKRERAIEYPAEWAQTPALGVMMVTLDNKAGHEEAALLPLQLKP